MTKYYNANIPTEIHFVYGGRHFGKTYYEFKKLKKQLEYLRSNEYLNQVKWERNFNEDLVKELQQRIDKAIEHIEESLYILKGDGDIPIATSNVRNIYIRPLLKILKGE